MARGDEALSVDRFRELYPWPEGLAGDGNLLEWLWHFDVDASPEELWPHLADTSRFNRAIGLSEMEFDERDGVLHGAATNAGFRHEWVEVPWDWVCARKLEAVRLYSRGFSRAVRVVYHLEPRGEGASRFYVYFGFVPRGVFGAIMLRLGMGYVERGYRRVVGEIERDIAAERPSVYVQAPPELPGDIVQCVDGARTMLAERGVPDEVIDRLCVHIVTGDELDLYRIQVRALARAWEVDEAQLLRACLHATRIGLLDMSWDVICPHCRGVREEASTLGDLPKLGACDVCAIDFTTDKENAIEITFHVHPSVRAIPKRHFCSAEPASKDHIQVQQKVPAGASVALETALRPGRYRARVKGEETFYLLDVARNEEAEELAFTASTGPSAERVAPRPNLTLTNDTGDELTFVLEHAMWADTALRPAHLFNFQEFRDLFSEQYLAADVQLSVGEQTILFTDIVGSTRFYDEKGDPQAFAEVKQHFTQVFDIVGTNHGAVVKTIGDAAMGAFARPLDAVRAAKHIHDCFHKDRADTPIRVRISLNTGPCIAVKLNSNIDYFGGTVNLAAKLQACAGAGDIAMSTVTADAPGVRDYMTREDARLEPTTYTSPALAHEVPVICWKTF